MSFFGQSFVYIDTMIPRPWNNIIKFLLAVTGLAWVLTKAIKTVSEGEQALKLRFGKVVRRNGTPVVLNPGMVLVVPFTHKLVRVSTLDQSVALRNVTLRFSKYDIVRLRAMVTFTVVDIYRVRYVAEDFQAQLTAICEAGLRESVVQVGNPQIEEVASEIIAAFTEVVAAAAAELGVAFKRLDITSAEPNALGLIAEAIRDSGTSTTTGLGGIIKSPSDGTHPL